MAAWWQSGYPGGPMVEVKGFPRPLYPPDAAPAYPPSSDGDDVEGIRRTVSRAGRAPWEWATGQNKSKMSNTFSHGAAGGNVGESGVAGVQRQLGLQPTGYVGKSTFNGLRSIRIPAGLPHAGEPAMDATAVRLINAAYDKLKAQGTGKGSRDVALEHMAKRLGYTESPANSNCDSRPDGIRTAQDHTAGGTWLRGEPWCGCWCYYALESAKVQGIDSHLASVAQIEEYAKQGAKCYRGWTTDRAKIRPGDLVVIGGYGVHVEMVRGPASSNGNVPTYGGNTSPGSSGSQSNGGGAYERTRYPSEVRGFALVEYPGD